MRDVPKFASLAVVLLAGVFIGAAADRAISRMDIRTMTLAQRNQQFRNDLMSILVPNGTLYRSKRASLDGYTWMHTKASATPYESLCQRDTVNLFYATIEKVGGAAEWRAKPYKIETRRSYRFVAPPDLRVLEEQMGEPRSPFAVECRKADRIKDDGELDGWFVAQSPESALDAGFAMLALTKWASRSESQYENCREDADPAKCKTDITYALGAEVIDGYWICPSAESGVICVTLSDIFTIRARKTGKPMQVQDIISVEYDVRINVA